MHPRMKIILVILYIVMLFTGDSGEPHRGHLLLPADRLPGFLKSP